MYRLNVSAAEVATFLKVGNISLDLVVNGVCSHKSPKEQSLAFITRNTSSVDIFKRCIVLCPKDYPNSSEHNCLIRVHDPKFSYAKVLSKYIKYSDERYLNNPLQSAIHKNIDPSVTFGVNCVIGDQVSIGKNSKISSNVVIKGRVAIGSNCYIKSGVIIGEDGFGFAFDQDQRPFRVPHLGSVEIGDYVEIGSNCTISRGTIENTVIKDYAKLDDQVHIAHNCIIGVGAIITAGVVLSGGVEVGTGVWIGPNSSVIQKKIIGNNALIGIGSVVTESVQPHQKIMGLSAMSLRLLSLVKKMLKTYEA